MKRLIKNDNGEARSHSAHLSVTTTKKLYIKKKITVMLYRICVYCPDFAVVPPL